MSHQQYNAKMINVCGIGPGNRELIVPEVFRLVAESSLLIGGKRHLEIFNVRDKESCVLSNNIEQIIETLKSSEHTAITVLVSGDTGFHSLLTTLLGHFSPTELNVVPGISSYQYFFAKLSMTYHDAWIGSVHGMTVDYVMKVKSNRKTFLLTDSLNSWKQIAEHLSQNGLGECDMYVGNRLSYPDEQILSGTANELKEQQHDFTLCSVIILNKDLISNE
jgi:cobalt-precorrin-7 (C5)-methyltransferase